MKEYEKYLIETLRNNADHFMTTDYEWSNALVHLLLDSADAIEQKKELAEIIGLDSEICDLPYTLRSIVVSKPNMGSFSKETISKAADAIEELQTRNDKQMMMIRKQSERTKELLAAVPKWVSVEERLPDDRRDVLCLLENKVVRILKFSPVQTTWFPQGFSYEHNGMNIRQTGNNVTHWMPLSEPPKEVRDV